MTKPIMNLKKDDVIELLSFPFENINKKTITSINPSNLTCDNDLITCDSEMLISNTLRSEIFDEIEQIIGRKNHNDIRHIDTAYKEKCHLFISPDFKDIISKGEQLFKLTGIMFYYTEDIGSIIKYIEKLKKTNSSKPDDLAG